MIAASEAYKVAVKEQISIVNTAIVAASNKGEFFIEICGIAEDVEDYLASNGYKVKNNCTDRYIISWNKL